MTNKGGRSYPTAELKIFYGKLDTLYLPQVGDFCIKVIARATKRLDGKSAVDTAWIRLGLEASKILMSKAPERIEQIGDKEYTLKVENGHIFIHSAQDPVTGTSGQAQIQSDSVRTQVGQDNISDKSVDIGSSS